MFNDAHLHLLVNHLPVVGSLLTLFLVIAALIAKSSDLEKAAYAGLVFTALTAAAAFYTGEPAEEIAETLPGVTKELIHEHEEAAEWAFRIAVIEGILAAVAIGLIFKRKKVPQGLKLTIAAGSLLTTIVMADAAKHGGEIRHTEIRSEQ